MKKRTKRREPRLPRDVGALLRSQGKILMSQSIIFAKALQGAGLAPEDVGFLTWSSLLTASAAYARAWNVSEKQFLQSAREAYHSTG